MKLVNKQISIMSVIAFFISWELIGRNINPVYISYPSAIISAFIEIGIKSSILSKAFIISFLEFIVGFGIAIPAGIMIGLLMGYFRTFESILNPFVNAIYALPRIVFIPIIIMWFGIEFRAKVVFIVLLSIFPVLINTYVGVRSTESSYLELAKSFKANSWQIIYKITLPASTPYIVAGIKLSAGMAIIGVILSEMFTAMTGLGYWLVYYANRFKTDRVFSVIIVIALFAIVINGIIKRVETKIFHWRDS